MRITGISAVDASFWHGRSFCRVPRRQNRQGRAQKRNVKEGAISAVGSILREKGLSVVKLNQPRAPSRTSDSAEGGHHVARGRKKGIVLINMRLPSDSRLVQSLL